MALHDELLELAVTLAEAENQAGARRSVTTAYYALFIDSLSKQRNCFSHGWPMHHSIQRQCAPWTIGQ